MLNMRSTPWGCAILLFRSENYLNYCIISPPLPHTRKNKHTNVLDDLFCFFLEGEGYQEKKTKKKHGRPILGWGKGRRLSNALFFLCVFVCYFFVFFSFLLSFRFLFGRQQIARNETVNETGKKVGPGGRVSMCVYIYYV